MQSKFPPKTHFPLDSSGRMRGAETAAGLNGVIGQPLRLQAERISADITKMGQKCKTGLDFYVLETKLKNQKWRKSEKLLTIECLR